MVKKIVCIFLIALFLINSSLLTVVSTAVDDINSLVEENINNAANINATQNISKDNNKKEKISLQTSYTKLTNRIPNELVITGILEKDTEDCALFSNPVIYFEFPKEVEKVVVNDVKVLYDEELQLKDYMIEENSKGNKVLKVELEGEQTKYQTDNITKGTNIRIATNIILKQDIETGASPIVMTCNNATANQAMLFVNANDNEVIGQINPEDDEGSTVYANGLMINTKAIRGTELLKDGSTIHSNEIIKYEISVTNTTDKNIENVKILGHIPENMTYVEYDEEAFSYYAETYTFLTDSKETSEDWATSLYQDDDLQYISNPNLKTKEFDVGTIYSGEKKTFYYEVEANKVEEDNTEVDTKIETTINGDNISTYNIKNYITNANFETRIRTYFSLSEKNAYEYSIIVKNISDEKHDATVTMQIPSNIEVTEISKLVNKNEGDLDYKFENGLLTVKYKDIEGGDYRAFEVKAKVNNISVNEEYKYEYELSAETKDEDGNIFTSNQSVSKGGIEAISITQSSEKNGEILHGYDDVTYVFEVENVGYVSEEEGGYTDFSFAFELPYDLKITSVTYNTDEVVVNSNENKFEYEITPKNKYYEKAELDKANTDDPNSETGKLGIRFALPISLRMNEKSTITIKAMVNSLAGQDDDKTIESRGAVVGDTIIPQLANTVTNTLQNNEEQTIIINPDDSEANKDQNNNVNTNNPSTSVPTEQDNKVWTLSGLAWVDNNSNGRRDEGEDLKEGVKVSLFDVQNNTFLKDGNGNVITVETNEAGRYSFTKVPTGRYYVVFEFDTDEYKITDFQKTGVVETSNNDAIEKQAKIGNEVKIVGITDTIILDSTKTNIDIGLVENQIFDLEMEQFITKVTVSNKKGNKEYTYDDKKFAKIEIHSKQFVGSTVVIEYKIKVTNVGELSGFVYEMIDQLPQGLDFHSELNSGWSKSLSTLSTAKFLNTEIKPGESIEIPLTLSITLDETSGGSYENVSQIKLTDNSRHIDEANKENNIDRTTVLIAVSTGFQIALKYLGTSIALAALAVLFYIAIRKINNFGGKAMFTFIMICALVVTLDRIPISNAGFLDEVKDVVDAVKDYGQNAVDDFKDAANDIKDAITGGSDSSSSNNSSSSSDDNNNSGSASVDESGLPTVNYEPQEGETQEDYDARIAAQEAARLQAAKDQATARYGEYGIDVSQCGSISDVNAMIDSCVTNYLNTTYGESGLSIPEGSTADEAIAAYNAKKEENLNTLKDKITSSDALKNVDVDSLNLGDIDLNALQDLDEDLSKIMEQYPAEKQFKGDPDSYYVDESGKGHFQTFVDEQGNTVAACISKGKAQTSQVFLDYELTESDLTLTTDGDGTLKWQFEATYTPTEDWCGREVQQMKVTLGDEIESSELDIPSTDKFPPEETPPTIIIPPKETPPDDGGDTPDNPDTPDEPDNPDNPPDIDIPEDGKAQVTIVKKDVDTEEEFTGGFRFRVVETGQEFEAGETITLEPNQTYHLEEIDSPFGYDIYEEDGSYKTFEINLQEHLIKTTIELRNALSHLRLSGYVWEDMLDGKSNEFDNVFTEGTDKGVEGVKVILYNDGNVVGETWTDAEGKYTFGDRTADLHYTPDTILIEDLFDGKYHVEFEYNGIKYSNVEPQLDIETGSKAIEGNTARTEFNNKFTVITTDKTAIDDNGHTSGGFAKNGAGDVTATDITYQRSGDYASSVIYGDSTIYDGTTYAGSTTDYSSYGFEKYHIRSSTDVEDFRYKFEDTVELVLENEVYQTKEIKNVNLGLYAREQVDLGLDSDVARFDLAVNNYHHIYKYSTIVDPNTEETMGVKLKALKENYYQRPLHEASIVYSADDGTTGANGNLYADITYKIYLQNKSNTLKAKINELTLNYGSQLTCISYNFEGEPAIAVTEPGGTTGEIKEIDLDLNQLGNKTIEAKNRQILEVTFRANADVIAEILNDVVTLKEGDTEIKGIKFDFMAEIKSYSTYASDDSVYASIDSNSAPRNARVETDEQNRFITDTFENDTTIAPTFILTKGSQTVISGTVYEDNPEEDKLKENERVGNGIFDENESVMANVKVELLLVPVDANEMYDSTMARDNITSKHTYELAKLYKTDSTGTQTAIGDAVTYTDENGNYTFEGVIADNYVIRYTYGENISGEGKSTVIYNNGTQVKEEPIKAREYKSTVITSDYIRKAINTSNDGIPHLNGDWSEGDTNQSWFLNDNMGTRYSDAVDDVEYRAYFEQNAKLNNENIEDSSKYAYSEMEAYTPYIRLGVEQLNDQNIKPTLTTQENGTIDYEYKLQNVDFGLIERPIVDLQVDKQITDLSVTLANGQVPIKGNPSNSDSEIPYVRTGIDDFVPIEMDTELTEGATIEEEYTISVSNNSELDYPIYKITNDTDVANERNYYFYGEKGNNPVTVRIGTLVDYLTPEVDVDLDEMKRNGWEVAEIEDLIEHKTTESAGEKTYRLITENVEKALRDGKYIIFTTDSFADENDSLVKIGETKSITYNISKLLTTRDEMKYTNDIEILEYIGYSQNKDKNENVYNRVKDTTPGNLIPERAKEDDEDSVRTTITPPTGIVISKILYIITVGIGLITLVIGVIFIKKRILNK